MAAAVLTSLSTSPVVLGHHPNGFSAEMNCDVWKAAPVRSSSCSSSNHSGDGSWDPPSDFSTPSTPSPPLTGDITTSILSSLQSDLEETEATQFLFGEPVPRKRKNSTKVMFKCLWKSCGKVLSSSSGMQKHIRAIHLGRKADLDQSDGEEDFYYTELDVNVDSLTDGLSSLTPVSPTSPVPPPFPVLEEVQKILPIPLNPKVSVVSHLSQSAPLNLLSQSAPTGLAHIQTDHAYQAMGPTGVLADLKAPPAGMEISISWQQPALFPPPLPPVLFKSPSEAAWRSQEMPQSLRDGEPQHVVHGLSLEESLPAVRRLSWGGGGGEIFSRTLPSACLARFALWCLSSLISLHRLPPSPSPDPPVHSPPSPSWVGGLFPNCALAQETGVSGMNGIGEPFAKGRRERLGHSGRPKHHPAGGQWLLDPSGRPLSSSRDTCQSKPSLDLPASIHICEN
uniref:SLC2A4 regulator n=1 Tax=Naja naja TaxID=35670 RepID=A0A8C6X205_NAJNA